MGANNYFIFGDEVKFYYNTGTDAVPVWVEIDNAEEPMVDLSKSEGTFKPRSIKFELTRGAKHQWAFSWKYSLTRAVDTVKDDLFDSFVNGTPIQFALTDRDIADAEAFGVKAWCEVMKFPISGKEEEGSQVDCEAKPTDYQEASVLIPPEPTSRNPNPANPLNFFNRRNQMRLSEFMGVHTRAARKEPTPQVRQLSPAAITIAW